MPKYEQVRFLWLSLDEEFAESTGEVIIRNTDKGSEMVLEIRDPQNESPYLIIGQSNTGKSYFSGINTAHDKTTEVEASWAEIDRSDYIGRWIEDGDEYLFKFSLPRAI
jgi:hypothetical protein